MDFDPALAMGVEVEKVDSLILSLESVAVPLGLMLQSVRVVSEPLLEETPTAFMPEMFLETMFSLENCSESFLRVVRLRLELRSLVQEKLILEDKIKDFLRRLHD